MDRTAGNASARQAALDAARAVLGGGAATADRRDLFEVRLERWWDDLADGLHSLYAPADADALAVRLVGAAARAYVERDPELHRLDLARTLEPDWLQSPSTVGYAAYADRFAGDLESLRGHVAYLRELGVTYLHLMPLLRPREGDNDGGYAVADYRAVRPDLGDLDDLRALTRDLRRAGISPVLDLVLNHVAREHAWAVAARAGDEHHRRYFHVFPDRTWPDAYERTLPEVFPDFAPGNFTWDDDLAGWVWTTFNSWQWDVDWANPDVFAEYADVVLFLANCGVEVVRLDAVAFLWKRLGTTGQNQPEVHAIVQALRAVARIACPAVAFKAEAIVGPHDLVQYLGQGAHHGKLSDLAYHNTLMVQVWSMLAAGSTTLAVHALRALPQAPSTSAWITYVRCHDDIGWAVDDRDAAAVGLDGPAHRSFLSDWYSGEFPTSTAEGLVFQYNPATHDRRISGTTASLTGLAAARRSGDGQAFELALGRVVLAHAVMYAWGGIPVLWSGDELGLPNDPSWAQEPGHEGDNRWAHRPRLPWSLADRRHEPGTVENRLFGALAHLARVRAQVPQLHASVPSEVLPADDDGVLVVLRRHPVGEFVALYNVTAAWRGVILPADLPPTLASGGRDALTGDPVTPGEDGRVWLEPYGVRWLTALPS